MSRPLPRLRNALDIIPSPAPGQPGLFIRDPYRYSDAMLVIPPPVIENSANRRGGAVPARWIIQPSTLSAQPNQAKLLKNFRCL